MSSSEVWKIFDAARADVGHRLQAELEQRAAVGGEDAAVVADDQLALVQRVDELRPAVEVQRVGVAVARVDQAVLDHARRHAQQHQQVLLHRLRAAGDVEHRGISPDGSYTGTAEQVSWVNWVKKWSSRAPTPARPRPGRCPCRWCRRLVSLHMPPTAGRAAPTSAFELGRRDHVHDHAVGVGQHHRRVGSASCWYSVVIS
jgi:hypothetical protein